MEQVARYPDPAIEVLDKSFARYAIFNAAVERLWTGARWCEGPVWFGDGRALIWSDIPNDRLLKWDETTGGVSTFRQPANNANGNTRDRQGRLVTCEHLARRVTRTEYDGSITVLMDRFEGRRLNSPNDVIVKSDGSIWFSDPTFGIRGHYEGEKAEPELPTRVYRIDGATGAATVVAEDVDQPNGLCFSPDETQLYVVESGTRPRRIRVYDVADGSRLTRGRLFFAGDGEQAPDGFRCDEDGNLWGGWGGGEGFDGVAVFAPSGDMIGRIHLPERCANLCFGGARRNRLFMAASRSLYAVYLNTRGAATV
ncbi:MAG TPA: SMP-30/gluconolactonase/LRE family protein [Rhodoblastus sp.]|nr:SMP-30/gluconolactonase/LRE family protein [Rhodoblastus sp.]